MIVVDWVALAIGMAAGTLMSGLFFAGLAFGMKHALRSDGVIKTLAVSAALRIGLFIGAGWLVLTQGGPWGFAGYGLAFFVCRSIATAVVRLPVIKRGAE